MSGSIQGVSDYGALGIAISSSASVRTNLDVLTEQVSTGLVANDYAGLGTAASVSISINPLLAQQQAWQTNIDAATASMSVTQTAMTQIQSIANDFYAQLNNLNGLNGSEIDSVAAAARQALQQVAGLLDTTDGSGNYVFAGQDSGNPPVPQPDQILSSGFYLQINAAVGALSTQGASATAAATLSIASSNAAGTSPFSTYMSQSAATLAAAAPSVRVGAETSVTTGLSASANTFVASSGSSTTGSYMRDLMRALATIGSLSSAQADDPNFSALVEDTRTSLGGAISAMAADAGALGNVQSGLADTKTTIQGMTVALTAQLSSAQDVDQAAAISKLQLTQTQLQASYQVIATLNGLSLAKFLPGA
ncbi:MAG: hypothetical protein JSR21_01025 [Proteobacteria bacterium]|nr:hypothetical protein [Pseudomonadota bacterium]